MKIQIQKMLGLAVPVMLSRIGLLLLIAVDLAMTGRAGSQELAFLSLALAPFVVYSVLGVGMMTGTSIMIAQAIGAGKFETCGPIWRVAVIHGAVIGAAFGLVSLFSESVFLLLGQDPVLAAGAGRVLAISAWGLPAVYMFVATVMFLEAAGRPRAGMVIMLSANGLNAALNWLFIYGNLGFPAMGADGAVLSTTLVRWVIFGLLVIYVFSRLDKAHWALLGRIPPELKIGQRLRQLGYPSALTYGLESSAFATMALFAGIAGVLHIAAYQITMNVVTLIYMMPLGIATATSILVGQAVGRSDSSGVRRAGWVGTVFASLVLVIVGTVTILAPDTIMALYTIDPAILAIGVTTMILASFVFLFDGIKEVLAGALRGTGDVWPNTIVNFVAFWLVMVPLGYYLSVVQEGGAPALFIAVIVGGIITTVFLLFRFHSLSMKPVSAV